MGYLKFKFKKKKKVKFIYKNNNMPNSVSRIGSLILAKPLTGGRNNSGICVFRNKGGGVKKFYRLVDFFHIVWEIPAFILRKEYDPFRTGFINLICYINGMLSYYLATDGLKRRNVLRTTNFFFRIYKRLYYEIKKYTRRFFIKLC